MQRSAARGRGPDRRPGRRTRREAVRRARPGGPIVETRIVAGRGAGAGPVSAPAFVRDELHLTETQQKQLDDLDADVRARLDQDSHGDQKRELEQRRERGPGGPPPAATAMGLPLAASSPDGPGGLVRRMTDADDSRRVGRAAQVGGG